VVASDGEHREPDRQGIGAPASWCDRVPGIGRAKGAGTYSAGDSDYPAGVEFTEAVDAIALGFEAVGITIITIGGIFGIIAAARTATTMKSFYEIARDGFARPLLLGLEVLVAADIIETILVDRTLESTAALGLLVLIRVVLSFSLGAETEGVLPWRKSEMAAQRALAARTPAPGETSEPAA
jgi:uncharacterized membrane protein